MSDSPAPPLPDGCVTITIAGPGMNALGSALMTDLLAQLDAAGSAPLLLVGEGRAFSAGLDLKEVLSLDEAKMAHFLELLESLTLRLFRHPAPTVAAVHGHAIAGGAVLSRMCDVVVAPSEGRGRIGLNEVALGLRFPPRLLRALTARVPRRHYTEVFLGAGLHAGPSAFRVGLVDVLTDDATPEGVRAAAIARLTALAAHPADAYAYAKRALQADVPEPSRAELDAFVTDAMSVWAGPRIKATIRTLLKL